MEPAGQDFLARIEAARSVVDIERACGEVVPSTLPGKAPGAREAFSRALAGALHGHLSRHCRHPQYRRWLDSYFGLRRESYRSPLQQPGYIYYPALAPVPWFTADEHPGLAPLHASLPDVAAEIAGFLATDQAFSPYVEAAAARDARWRALASSPAWSSLHLVKAGIADEALLASLPRTRAFLDAAPLAEYPPHAPECFISRLMPGVVLPPHFGVSNIKLTVHVPIDLPPQGCSITVAGETRHWREGEFLVFDDSFEHSAENLSDRSRTVLIFDVWHPGLDETERAALAHTIRALDATQRVLAGLG
jgi:hypothetical protein